MIKIFHKIGSAVHRFNRTIKANELLIMAFLSFFLLALGFIGLYMTFNYDALVNQPEVHGPVEVLATALNAFFIGVSLLLVMIIVAKLLQMGSQRLVHRHNIKTAKKEKHQNIIDGVLVSYVGNNDDRPNGKLETLSFYMKKSLGFASSVAGLKKMVHRVKNNLDYKKKVPIIYAKLFTKDENPRHYRFGDAFCPYCDMYKNYDKECPFCGYHEMTTIIPNRNLLVERF